MSVKIPGDVKDLSPTARLVHAVLDDAGPLAREEIEDRTGAARRTVNEVLSTLRAEGLATAHEHPNDARRKLYSIDRQHTVATPGTTTGSDPSNSPTDGVTGGTGRSDPPGERR